MGSLFRFFELSTKDQEGASVVEYAVLIALISALIIASVGSLGINVRDAFDTINYELSSQAPSDVDNSSDSDKENKCKDSPDDSDCGIGND